MEYFADISVSGPIRHDQTVYAVRVTASLDHPKRIGVACQVGLLEDGVAIWRLRIDGDQLPGLWVIVDRRFVPDDVRSSTP